MKPLRIGLVDLDTSHPGSFVPIIRALGHEITAVYDVGSVNPPGYAAAFAQEHGIAAVHESLDAMAEEVELAFIHSCNWDLHVERARPFIHAGKAVFIDKPLAGNIRDLRQIMEWSLQGAVITGGSSVRYCEELRNYSAKNIPSEDWIYGMAGCAVDEFNYGIHAYSMLHGLKGAGLEKVRHLGTTGQHQVELIWKDGGRGMVSIGKTAGYLPFYATVVTQKNVEQIKVDNSRLYQTLLETILPYFAGAAAAPIPIEVLAEAEMGAIAALYSREQGGRTIALRDIPEDYSGYDGAAFAQFYKKLKFPETTQS